MNEPHRVIVAVGSNQGDSRQNVVKAFERLHAISGQPIRASSLWETTPVDCPPGSPPFINAVVTFIPQAGETPESLLRKMQAIERDFGRRPKKTRNEPRPIDLDIVAFGTEKRSTPELVLPHPRAHLREFVLGPLAEIAPGMILPGQELPVEALLSQLRGRASQ